MAPIGAIKINLQICTPLPFFFPKYPQWKLQKKSHFLLRLEKMQRHAFVIPGRITYFVNKLKMLPNNIVSLLNSCICNLTQL